MGRVFSARVLVLALLAGALFVTGGCVRYARSVNDYYQPVATFRNGSGQVYLVIPDDQQTRSADVKWVLGTVRDDDGNKIDDLLSPRSGAELVQAALAQELKTGGYEAVSVAGKPDNGALVVVLTKADIDLEQVSDITDLKATCQITVGMDVYRNGALTRSLQYAAKTSRVDVRDRDQLARTVLQSALQSIMGQAAPDLHKILSGS